jgi:hypothetical protein
MARLGTSDRPLRVPFDPATSTVNNIAGQITQQRRRDAGGVRGRLGQARPHRPHR